MKKAIIGGIVTVVIGGTGFAISQADVVNNFSKETGMSQQQAQQYVSNAQNNLESFSKVGQEFTNDGNDVLSTTNKIDCDNYTYEWVSPSLSCTDGKNQLASIGNDEVSLGDCYTSLGDNLGDAVKSTISQCINDIGTVDASYSMPLALKYIQANQMTDMKNTNLYNKSVLEAALNSK